MPLSKSELKRFLAEPRIAHIATTSVHGKPRVNPIWYAYEDGCFYFTTRMGRIKGRHINKNPNVALSIATEKHPYKAVCVFGTAHVLNEGRDHWLMKIASRYGKKEAKKWFPEVIAQPDRVVILVKPTRILSWHYGRGDDKRQNKGESMTTVT
ncbi:MAG TPA: TIGR03618 family F420-dependent PPOX class oxidoreductase [Candidatus Saccharimonadales bacterium]|nr:TIGR03618 family F420-dependent PPOX class oxidoreductase [Candidatus Saccharimonadales bacterium]